MRGGRFDGPWCLEPGTADQPCTLSINQMMIHGDSQEHIYEFVDGAYGE